MEDDRISLLETQLAQARLIAEESDKKYEEVRSGLRVEVVGFWIIQSSGNSNKHIFNRNKCCIVY